MTVYVSSWLHGSDWTSSNLAVHISVEAAKAYCEGHWERHRSYTSERILHWGTDPNSTTYYAGQYNIESFLLGD